MTLGRGGTLNWQLQKTSQVLRITADFGFKLRFFLFCEFSSAKVEVLLVMWKPMGQQLMGES